jgi:nucleoside 2-deoxyribosyltransferase
VAIMDGADPDSGTSWEVGYAYASGKTIVLVRTEPPATPATTTRCSCSRLPCVLICRPHQTARW